MGAIKRTLRTLRGDPPGYGPLALDLSATSSGESNMMHFAPSSPTLSEFESDNEIEIDVPGFSCICTTERQVQRQKRQQVSTLPRPKTIILASLGLWTVLMALSASMGFNSVSIPALSSSIRPTTITGSPSKPITSTQEDNSNDGMIDLSLWEPSSSLGHGSDDHASEKTLPEWPVMRQGGFIDDVDDNSNALESEREQEEFIESMTSLLGLNFDDLDRDANMKVEEPFATIKTKVVLLNRRDSEHQQQQHSEEKASDKEETTADQAEDVTEQDIEDFFEPDWLEALTMDPEDAHVFHDFLAQLEAEDAATAEQQPSVIEAADEFVVASLLENNLGCGYRPAFLPTFMVQFTPDWLKNAPTTIQNLFVANGNVASTSSPHTAHTRSQVFDYLFGWTDVMIVAVAMSLGGLLAGLAHAKTGYYQLLEQHYARYYDSPYGYTLTAGGSTSWTTLTSCLIISASAFALTLLMIFAECWDVPSVYFVGIGIAGMILVHAWIPNIVLMVDTTESDSDDVEFDNEYNDGNNDANGDNGDEEKTVRDTWASPLTERRNACSLDESRRWERHTLRANKNA
ncbi:hypothetical protein BGZ99_001937 [Dissophora globulifera]|uniref:Uncharacterized protein n=1 Tax=Dissophora globulifera TaxID=979702 RepID=A0A9P6QZZ7_9FUNG|nr:hypothetical protein BGZ99_001937 [Dissophora globulifera]